MGDPGDNSAADIVAAAASLPLTERVVHKQWRVREDAYKQLAGKFKTAAEDSKIYPDFAPLLSKFARDTNAPAQLLGFGAIAEFAYCAPPQLVRNVAAPVGKAIADKGLTGRPTNVQRAGEAALMFVGADAGEPVVEAIISTGFTHRTPKVIAAAIDVVRNSVVTYGSKAVPVKSIASALAPLLTHSNEPVRKAAKALLVELHRWVGDAVRSVTKTAPDVTVKELDAAFAANAQKERPKAQKLTRAMEERVRDAPEGGGDDGDDPFADGAAEEEELDLAEEIDLLPLLPKMKINVEGEDEPVKDWYAGVESKKWRVRRDSLDFAVNSIGEARLIPGAYGDVVVRLRKIIAKDANVNCVASGAKLISALANGLRKNFVPGAAKALTTDLLGRLKEKNKVAVTPLAGALDALHVSRCIRIADLLDELTAASGNKVPKARAGLFLWMDRCFKAGTPAVDLKGAPLKVFGGLLVAATEDSTPDVRDAAIAALASLHVLVGERNMTPHMEKLDNIRKDKVLAIVKVLPPPKKVASAAAGPAGAAGKPVKASGPGRNKAGGPTTRSAAKAAKTAPAKPKRPTPAVSDDEGEVDIPADGALSRAASRFEGFKPEQWTLKSFKARSAAVGVIASALSEGDSVEIADASLVLAVLGVAPGVSDSNFMALKAKLELLGLVAEKCNEPLPRKTLKALLEPSVEKLGDIKCAVAASGIFMVVAEATSARYFFEILAKGTVETNNGRAKVGMAKFATSMVTDFGCPAVPMKVGVELVVSLLQDPPAALRNAALALAASLAVRSEPREAVRQAMEASGKVDGPMLELFDAELSKYSGDPDAPTRKKRFGEVSSVSTAQEEARAEPATAAEPPSPKPVVSNQSGPASSTSRAAPRRSKNTEASTTTGASSTATTAAGGGTRTNLAGQFVADSKIISGLRHANWKTRQDALIAIDSLVAEAGGCISGNVGIELMPELRRRFGDSNRNIAALAYGVVGRLGQAMGQGAAIHLKVVLPQVLSAGCVDIKKTVREAACTCLDLWYGALGLAPLVPFLHSPLVSINSSFRKEYLEWLVPRLSGEVGSFSAASEDLSSLVDPCLSCLQDRVAEVRQLGEFALESVVASVGFAAVESKVMNLGKTARLHLEPVVAKFRVPGGTGGVPGGNATSKSAVGRHGGGPPARTGIRERPRSVAVPPSPRGGGTVRRGGVFDSQDPSTPRGGLRRVRPASVRAAPAPELPPEPLAQEPVLREGTGRVARANRYLASKPSPGAEVVQGVVPYSAESGDVLAADLGECVSTDLLGKLTSPTNRFQQHMDAISLIVSAFREDPDALVKCADVLLRWAAFRIDDSRTPPTMLVKAAEFISSMCEVLISSGSLLGDYEASSIVPVLVDKCGSNRTAVREALLAALLSVGDVMDDCKLMAYLVESLKQTTNAMSKVEVASGLLQVIDRVCGSAGGDPPPGSMTVIAQIAYGQDEAAGRATAACIERVHQHIGDEVWVMVGEVTDEQAEILESRFPQVAGSGHGDEPPSPRPFNEVATGTYVASGAVDYPHSNIRAEDFRLSVAPAPPTNVMSAIGDSMATPRRNVKPEQGRADLMVEATPSLPARRGRPGGIGNFSFISSAKDSHAQSVTDLLASDVRSEQEQGLINLFDNLAEPQSPLLYDCAGEVLPLLSRGFRDCVERLEDGSADEHEQHILKQYLNALMAYVSAPSVVRGVTQQTIEQLLCDVVDAMIPDEMPSVDDWDRVRRGVNLAVLKILETCDQNLLYTALLNLLLVEMRIDGDPDDKLHAKSHPDDKLHAKSQLLVKSVAKVAKRRFADVRVDFLLRDLNSFVTSLAPSRGWSSNLSGESEALGLVRTVVDAVMREKGQSVYEEMALIPSQDASPVVKYITSVLPEAQSASPRGSSREVGVTSGHVVRGVDKTDPQEKLAEIFDHMLSAGGGDAGLRRLRAFMLCYPDVDINPYINKCSQAFQEFVRGGLEAISAESPEVLVKTDSESVSTDASSSPSEVTNSLPVDTSSSSAPRSGSDTSGQAYLKRLREIQLKYGLPELKKDGDAGTGVHPTNSSGVATDSSVEQKGVESVEKENGDMGSYSVTDTRDKATALRERMARIREASKE